MPFQLLATATSALDDTTVGLITNAASSMQATAVQVIGLVVGATIAVIALSSGVDFALKKIKGVISHAS